MKNVAKILINDHDRLMEGRRDPVRFGRGRPFGSLGM